MLLGEPVLDPSGRDIPLASTDISERIESTRSRLCSLANLSVDASGTLEAMFLSASEVDLLESQGCKVGIQITRLVDGYSLSDQTNLVMSPELASKLLVRIHPALN